jgi:DNA-binding LacI/PurR family transcriptional regulator
LVIITTFRGAQVAATIKDVATEAGTSISTVSKALNNSPAISGETVERVKKAAEKLNYRPNARARTFARQSSSAVAFLTKLPEDIAFTNPHMFEILAGAEKALSNKGYAVILRGCDENSVCSLVNDITASKFADGLLLHASVVTKELAVLLTRLETPHIVLGKPDFNSSLSWIDNNNQLAGEIAAGFAVEAKYKTIAFIGGLDKDKISQDRLVGIQNRLNEHGLKIDRKYIWQGEPTVADGRRMGTEMVTASVLPDLVICANNYLAYGCLRALRAQKIIVPDDVSIITFDDYPLAQVANPMFTTVSINLYEIGIAAGKLLMKKIRQPNLQVQTFTTAPKLIQRGSTKDIIRQSGEMG